MAADGVPEAAMGQVHLLLADLHRQMMVKFSKATGQQLQGLGSGARLLRLSNRWQRRAREIDAAFGLARKITPASIAKYMADLDKELGNEGPEEKLSEKKAAKEAEEAMRKAEEEAEAKRKAEEEAETKHKAEEDAKADTTEELQGMAAAAEPWLFAPDVGEEANFKKAEKRFSDACSSLSKASSRTHGLADELAALRKELAIKEKEWTDHKAKLAEYQREAHEAWQVVSASRGGHPRHGRE